MRALHVEVDPLVNAVILEGPDHLQAGPVTDMGKPWISVPAEVPLQDLAVLRAVEERAPGFQLLHAVRCLLGMQLGHARVVHVLPAAHRVGKVDAPVIAVVHVSDRGRHAALRHNRVGLAKQRFANDADAHAGRRGFDGGAQAGASGADDQDVVVVGAVVGHRLHYLTTGPGKPPPCRNSARGPRNWMPQTRLRGSAMSSSSPIRT